MTSLVKVEQVLVKHSTRAVSVSHADFFSQTLKLLAVRQIFQRSPLRVEGLDQKGLLGRQGVSADLKRIAPRILSFLCFRSLGIRGGFRRRLNRVLYFSQERKVRQSSGPAQSE